MTLPVSGPISYTAIKAENNASGQVGIGDPFVRLIAANGNALLIGAPYSAGTQIALSQLYGKPTGNLNHGGFNFTSPGSYTFTVPAGVHQATAIVVGGGGGGGGTDGGGDSHAGGGGGSGGYQTVTTAVTPGNTYTVVVGTGGKPGACTNGSFSLAVPNNSGNKNGTNGTSSTAFGVTSTGGIGGIGDTSDNNDGRSGAGGSPGGVAGGPINPNRNAYNATAGGVNGTGYGTGGNSNGAQPTVVPSAGGNGAVLVSW